MTKNSLLLASLLALSPCCVLAQAALETGRVVSPVLSADNKTIFGIYAPNAETVQLASNDIPKIPFGQGMEMSRTDIKPYIESKTGRGNTAIAGLSMGGGCKYAGNQGVRVT